MMKKLKELKKSKELKKPSKKAVKGLVAAAAVMAVIGGTGALAAESLEQKQEQKAYEVQTAIMQNQAQNAGLSLISSEEAKQIALQAAGVEESQVKRLRVQMEDLDEEEQALAHAQYVYEVEFTHNGLEYELYVDGVEKTVLHSDVE